MENFGFVKVAAAIPQVRVADCIFNRQQIENLIIKADGEGVCIVVFPELSITGYSCADLFGQKLLLDSAEKSLQELLENTRHLEIISIVGMPILLGSALMNCAVVLQKGRILGVVPKTYLPNYKEFNEKRWFVSSRDLNKTEIRLCEQNVPLGASLLFETAETCFGIEICEDLWATLPPSSTLALSGAEIIFNLSASSESVTKHAYLRSLLSQHSMRCLSGYVYASSGFGESTTDIVFGGNGFVFEKGILLASAERFLFDEQLIISEIDVECLRTERQMNTTFSANKNAEIRCISAESVKPKPLNLTRKIEAHPFVPQGAMLNERCEEIFEIQVAGLAKRLMHTHSEKVVLGISGGLDSTLALLVCVRAFDKLGLSRKGIIGITMPGFGTTDRTYNNALKMMSALGVSQREISIKDACVQHFKDIEHDINRHDVTYENSQARERTQVLMDVANQQNALVIGTGDLSELALGWATYNGDHMSMYGVNGSVPKTLVKHLVAWFAQRADDAIRHTLLDVVETPISPELIPADEQGNIKQKTEDLVGPYELHDFFLYYFVRYGFRPAKIYFLAKTAFGNAYGDDVIKHWLTVFCRRFFQQQFKRSCLPDGPKVGSVSLSPRGDWRMPSDACAALWLQECEAL